MRDGAHRAAGMTTRPRKPRSEWRGHEGWGCGADGDEIGLWEVRMMTSDQNASRV
jgi:hypothetical protein